MVTASTDGECPIALWALTPHRDPTTEGPQGCGAGHGFFDFQGGKEKGSKELGLPCSFHLCHRISFTTIQCPAAEHGLGGGTAEGEGLSLTGVMCPRGWQRPGAAGGHSNGPRRWKDTERRTCRDFLSLLSPGGEGGGRDWMGAWRP